MRSLTRAFVAAGLSVSAFAFAAPARADASAWAFVGGGALIWKYRATDAAGVNVANDFQTSPTMTFDVGVGTTPDAPVIIGAFGRIQPIFGSGTDLALLARGATRGFQGGGWGAAIDAGAYLRTWGANGSQGFTGALTLGMPLGFQLSVQGMWGSNDARGFGAVAGIDFLRLTVYRKVLLDRWENPAPAWTRTRRAGLARFLF